MCVAVLYMSVACDRVCVCVLQYYACQWRVIVCVLQYSVLLLIVFLLEAGSGVVTYLYEINVSST